MNKLIISSLIIVLFDFLYLYKFGFGTPYVEQIKLIQKSDFRINYYYAIIAYALIVFGLNYFVLKKSYINKKQKYIDAFIYGVITYGIYDFTNATLFSVWDIGLSIQDVLYGGVLMVIAALVTDLHSF